MTLEEAIKTTRFDNETHKAALNILFTAWWLKTALSQALKEHALTHEQYNVLRILKGSHPDHLCVRDITSRMIEKSSNVPRIIDRLVGKRLVKRAISESDRRESVISLTPIGSRQLEQSGSRIAAILQEQINISVPEAHKLNLLLEKMRQPK